MAVIGSAVRRAIDEVGRVVRVFDEALERITLSVEASSRDDQGSSSEVDESGEELHVEGDASREKSMGGS